MSSGKPVGYASAGINAGALAGKAGLFGSNTGALNTGLGIAGNALGLYSGIQQGGVRGDLSAAVNAASLANSAGLFGSGALSGAIGTAATGLGLGGAALAAGNMIATGVGGSALNSAMGAFGLQTQSPAQVAAMSPTKWGDLGASGQGSTLQYLQSQGAIKQVGQPTQLGQQYLAAVTALDAMPGYTTKGTTQAQQQAYVQAYDQLKQQYANVTLADLGYASTSSGP